MFGLTSPRNSGAYTADMSGLSDVLCLTPGLPVPTLAALLITNWSTAVALFVSSSIFHREIDYHYPVYVGQEFWEHLTGSVNFYDELSTAIGEIALEFDGPGLLEETIQKLAKDPVIVELANR